MNMDSSLPTMTTEALMPTPTITPSSATANTSAPTDYWIHHRMDMGGGCKISMLWNWYTVDACFLSRSWRIHTPAAFAGSCIGVILLVMSLELLRRLSREYDAFCRRKDSSTSSSGTTTAGGTSSSSGGMRGSVDNSSDSTKVEADGNTSKSQKRNRFLGKRLNAMAMPTTTALQRQLVRAVLHMVTFAVAYFVMLLAMYYNGTSRFLPPSARGKAVKV
ncbi:MAG: hypothetical protein Q9227_009252 [Pyrenula ochraceoflavens]